MWLSFLMNHSGAPLVGEVAQWPEIHEGGGGLAGEGIDVRAAAIPDTEAAFLQLLDDLRVA
ncbi:hypothetical protein AU193_04520 [Mycobacterium sp. GA-1285]|uniref:hypothetical protein n=1 Tax=Mycobacterium sp. GA-1285 TaxID=1772282 RepID=UPI00074906BF|nr:hypothetical protein [Mycobacterium sp. GA-1285]KUI13006.1 hypothetical protein AU193_04520 [Mycobacterium sp. GA-1285]